MEYKKSNYHTHTYRCNHASGTDEEYIIEAIKNGYDLIAFSDHVMLPWTINQSYVRASFDKHEEYIQSINTLKEKYKDKIKILLAYECEYQPGFVEYYSNLLNTNTMDFLILGNHYPYYDFKTGEFSCSKFQGIEYVKEYVYSAIEAMKTKLFRIFAHPDLFMMNFDDWNTEVESLVKEMCIVAKENNVALEINQACLINDKIRKYPHGNRYRYPYSKFWDIVKQVGNEVVTNIDAHSPQAFNREDVRKKVFEFAREKGIEITIELKIK